MHDDHMHKKKDTRSRMINLKGSVLLNMLTGTHGRANHYRQRSYVYGTYQKKTKRCTEKMLLQRNHSLKTTARDI